MKILITYALEAEKGDVQIPGSLVSYCCTGVGKVSTAINTYEALMKEKPDMVVNIGTAGTLHHQVGEIVVCSHFFDRDLEKIAHLGVPFTIHTSEALLLAGSPKNTISTGTVSTGDTFLTDLSESGSHADVFDMEAFATAQVCQKLNIPFFSVKYVTDVIGQNSIKHWEEKLEEARIGLAEFLKTIRF